MMNFWTSPRGYSAIFASVSLMLAGCASKPEESPRSSAGVPKKPNFLLVVADDLGYSDMGAYGGEIATPTLNRMAKEGSQLTHFYASPFCAPTRAMLMSGADNHRVGLGDMAEFMTDVQRGKPGYEGYLNQRAAAMPEVLRSAGYRTVMAGKWHLGNAEDQSPAARGFDRSFAMTMGGSSHYGDQSGIVALDPQKAPKAIYRQEGKMVDIPRQGFYSSEAFATRLIQYLDETRGDGGKPFFAYLAFTAPHWPLHAPDEDVEKYAERYKNGYEALRTERMARMKQLGVIPKNTAAYPGHPHWLRWEQLSADQQRAEAKRMAVYAAMVDNMDRQLGRVLTHLEKTGELENTVVVFMSDNGADGNSVYDVGRTREWIRKDMDNSIENTGRPGSFTEYGPGWAQVGMTPFRLYKSFMHEGGISVPAIVWGPGSKIKTGLRGEVAHVMDIAPTFYELAGAVHPAATNSEALPVQGRSMLAWLRGEKPQVHGADDAIGWELGGRKALRKGDWKIVQANKPWGSGKWELYNIVDDRVESFDLAAAQPEKLAEMVEAWKKYMRDNGVLEIEGLDSRPGYSNAGLYYEDLALEAVEKPGRK